MFRSASRSTVSGLNWCFVKPESLARCIDIGLVASLIRMRSGTLRVTEHPNQAEPQAQRAPRPNRVSYENSSRLSPTSSPEQTQGFAEGLSSTGIEREINGRQGEGKISY
jgi:hypothetical protein